MNIDTVRTLMTLLSFAMFVGVIWWAYRARNEDRFRDAANLPFSDDETENRGDGAQQ